MRTEQYFQPGDKVMRVGNQDERGRVHSYQGPKPEFGVVYCVEDFWEGPIFNVVMLVGFGGWRYDPFGRPIGWAASAFRKVEEIKLCVAALNHAKAPQPVITP